MDKHLKLAQTWLMRANEASYTEQEVERLRYSVGAVLRHLESQLPQEAPQASETPSSPATGQQEETKPTSSISSMWLFPANRSGRFWPSQAQAILDWLNSQDLHGSVQVEVTLSIHTLKASTPQSGSHSPSTAEPTRGLSGAAGERCVDGEPTASCTRLDCFEANHCRAAPEPSLAPSHEAREEPRLVIFAKNAALWICPQCKSQLSLDVDECDICRLPRPFTYRDLS